MAAKPDQKVMEEVANLQAMKDTGFVRTPEYLEMSKNIKRKYFGDPGDRRKKVPPLVYGDCMQPGT